MWRYFVKNDTPIMAKVHFKILSFSCTFETSPVHISENIWISLKGQCHEMDILLWRSKYFNQYFLCMRWLVERSLAPKKWARIYFSQAASGMILQNHQRPSVSIFRVKITALGSLKRITERISKLVIKEITWRLIFSSAKKQKIAKLYKESIKKVLLW